MSGHEVDVGGEGLIFKYRHTKLESEFLTLRSGTENAVERSNGWSCALFWQLGPSPPYVHLVSTSCPPDVIHMMNAPRPSLFFAGLPLPCIIVNANRR